jgi:anti-anti-sigma regulatory factor
MAHFSSAELLEVDDVRDGIRVRLRTPCLEEGQLPELTDDLLDIAAHRHGPRLYLDFETVERLADDVSLRLAVLARRLEDSGDRLVLLGLRPELQSHLLDSGLDYCIDSSPVFPGGGTRGARYDSG